MSQNILKSHEGNTINVDLLPIFNMPTVRGTLKNIEYTSCLKTHVLTINCSTPEGKHWSSLLYSVDCIIGDDECIIDSDSISNVTFEERRM
jgi:hypothetical protein